MVDGIPELKARFERIKHKLMAAVEEPMKEGANKIADSARQLVPRESGRLRASIRVTDLEKTRNHKNPMIRVIAGEGYIVGKRAKFNLARIKEFGTAKQRAEPFLRPSARRHRPTIRAAIRRAIMQALLQDQG